MRILSGKNCIFQVSMVRIVWKGWNVTKQRSVTALYDNVFKLILAGFGDAMKLDNTFFTPQI